MKVFIIIISAIAVLVLAALFYMFFGMAYIKKMIINDVDLSKISDGTYKGSFRRGRWNYDAEVTVKNHKIVSVSNSHKSDGMFAEVDKAIEKVFVEKQSVVIDTVSGATVFTKAYQKAVENALTGE